jgi:F0F1-type ATP synthase epsilon subunit
VKVEVITPQGVAFSGDFDRISFKTPEGEVETLSGHAPYSAYISGKIKLSGGVEIDATEGLILIGDTEDAAKIIIEKLKTKI